MDMFLKISLNNYAEMNKFMYNLALCIMEQRQDDVSISLSTFLVIFRKKIFILYTLYLYIILFIHKEGHLYTKKGPLSLKKKKKGPHLNFGEKLGKILAIRKNTLKN